MNVWTQEDCDRLACTLYRAQILGGAIRSRPHHDQVVRRFCGGMDEREMWRTDRRPTAKSPTGDGGERPAANLHTPCPDGAIGTGIGRRAEPAANI